jgi:hypothetical protein
MEEDGYSCVNVYTLHVLFILAATRSLHDCLLT